MSRPSPLELALVQDGVVLTRQDLALRYTALHRPAFDTPAGVIGRTDGELMPRAAAEVLTRLKENVLASGNGARVEARLELSGGSRLYELTLEPLREAEGGGICGVACAALDVTERTRAEEALAAAHDTFRHLVEHSPFGVYVVDEDFRLVQVSAGARKVFENVRPLIGRDFEEVLRILWPEPFASEALSRFRQTLATGEPYRSPSTVEQRQDTGETESYDWKVERITLPDGRLGVVCHFYDLSERRRYEAALRETDRRKDEFLATLAHELRNPLAPLRNAVQVLRLSDSGPQRTWAQEMMERQIHVMSRLLDDLLDISRLSRDRLDLQMTRVDLAEVVASAVETSRPLLDGLGHRLVIALPPDPIVLDADAVRLEQVLANLLNNAARYTPTGGRIEISARREGTTAVVSVSDNGVGITAEEMPRLFEIFAQAKPALERASGGLGIGLSLARGLVERHGGTVEARSGGAGQGSEFVVRLPVSHESVAVSGTAPPEIAAPVRRLTVLVVDDLRDSADSLAEFIRAMGHVVHTSYDGDSALATAREVRPDVVLLDLGMPGVTGYETCRRIRQDARERRPYIVAVTGFGQEQDRLRTAAAGFDHHLVKPVPPATLSRLLSSVAAG